jgi:6-phosphogluconolactonase
MIRNITRFLIFTLCLSLTATAAWADGAVYAMTNAIGNNQILVYHRASNGALTQVQTIATGGGGSGEQLSAVDALGSQGSLVLDPQHHLLFAVNTESLAANSQDCQQGTITSFLVASDGTLTFADRVNSSGLFPNSLTFKYLGIGGGGGVLYVLNAGGPGSVANGPATGAFCGTSPNITGFSVDSVGHLSLIPDAAQGIIDPGPLDGIGSGVNCPPSGFPVPSFDCGLNPPAFPRSPAEVRFTPSGTQLVVTVKGTNKIYVFPVGANGALTVAQALGPTLPTPSGVYVLPTFFGVAYQTTVTQAPGPALPTYFGFTFGPDNDLIVTEAFGKATTIPAGGTGAVSSFVITGAGSLQQITADVGDGGTAACWIALEPTTGKYAYVSNNLSNTLSSYSVGGDGSLALLNASAATGSGPNDLTVVADSGASFLYVLDALSGTVAAFQVNLANGALNLLQPVGGLPVNAGAQGLAAY